ncbi:MAG: peptidoglycan editing factor PgeF [Gammaproteobacteria bacterium]|nr:peptidoglycan editing factor PgeF [Gammaproteobacteria bacterium]NNF66975.1 peptidoglycan editing factor PgeF [Gammaproteobacteria bacterium]
MNLGDHVGDDPLLVHRNREALGRALQWPSSPTWLQQCHSRNIIRSDASDSSTIADAAWTPSVGSVCVVMTADCLPLLLSSKDGKKVAAVHVGWRGLAAGIIEVAIAQMGSGGELMAWLGPAIGAEDYEIDAQVRSKMLQADPDATSAFVDTRAGHWNMDLYELARRRLRQSGVRDIFGGHFCTYSDPEQFFSYRRDGVCGRMASLIWRES